MNNKVLAVMIIVIMLISGAAAYVLTSNNTSKNISEAKNGFTELYISVPNVSDIKIAQLSDGTTFNYTPSGSKYSGSINESMNISLAIVNHEGQSMNYTIFVYQTESDIKHPESNITPIYRGATRIMYDNDTLTSWIRIPPAYVNNSTRIGIALLQDQPDGNSLILNNSEVNANITP